MGYPRFRCIETVECKVHITKKRLWNQAQKSSLLALQPKMRDISSSQTNCTSAGHTPMPAATLLQNPQSKDDSHDIILKPETRPISQDLLPAEVKGIYAGLAMVEAKCIEVDNKRAALTQADRTYSPINEQW
jgi:hypothetical protein